MTGMDGMDGMVQSVIFGSGWAGLLGCMVVGALATVVLGAAGRAKARGRSWAVTGVVGVLLVLAAVALALTALGSFFGLMGIAFAVFQCIGAWTAFQAPVRAEERLREQEEHAARLGAAYARGASAEAQAPAAPTTAPAGSDLPRAPEPSWYPHDGPAAGAGRGGTSR